MLGMGRPQKDMAVGCVCRTSTCIETECTHGCAACTVAPPPPTGRPNPHTVLHMRASTLAAPASSGQCSRPTHAPAAQVKHQVHSGAVTNAVVCQRAAVLQVLASEGEALLVHPNACRGSREGRLGLTAGSTEERTVPSAMCNWTPPALPVHLSTAQLGCATRRRH